MYFKLSQEYCTFEMLRVHTQEYDYHNCTIIGVHLNMYVYI